MPPSSNEEHSQYGGSENSSDPSIDKTETSKPIISRLLEIGSVGGILAVVLNLGGILKSPLLSLLPLPLAQPNYGMAATSAIAFVTASLWERRAEIPTFTLLLGVGMWVVGTLLISIYGLSASGWEMTAFGVVWTALGLVVIYWGVGQAQSEREDPLSAEDGRVALSASQRSETAEKRDGPGPDSSETPQHPALTPELASLIWEGIDADSSPGTENRAPTPLSSDEKTTSPTPPTESKSSDEPSVAEERPSDASDRIEDQPPQRNVDGDETTPATNSSETAKQVSQGSNNETNTDREKVHPAGASARGPSVKRHQPEMTDTEDTNTEEEEGPSQSPQGQDPTPESDKDEGQAKSPDEHEDESSDVATPPDVQVSEPERPDEESVDDGGTDVDHDDGDTQKFTLPSADGMATQHPEESLEHLGQTVRVPREIVEEATAAETNTSTSNANNVQLPDDDDEALRSHGEAGDAVEDDEDEEGILNRLLSRIRPSAEEDESANASEELSDHVKSFISPEDVVWDETYAKLGDDYYARTYTITRWPFQTQSHFLYDLWRDSRIIYDTKVNYEPFSRSEAIDVLAGYEDQMEDKAYGEFSQYIPNSESIRETVDIIKEMKKGVENRGQRLYEMSVYVTVYAREKDYLPTIDRDVRNHLEVSAGFDTTKTPQLPDLGLVSSSPLAMDPVGELRENATQLVLDTSAAMTFPFLKDTVMEEGGVMLGINNANSTAVVLDIFDRKNGYNLLRLGTIGSGKSFSEGQYLIRHYMEHPEDNIVIIDPMGGFVGVNEAIGGQRVVVNGQKTINPLEISETPKHVLKSADFQANPYRMKLEDVHWFFERFFDSRDTTLKAHEWAILDRAIKTAYKQRGITPDPRTHSNESPTLQDVMDILQDIANNPAEAAMSESQVEVNNWENIASRILMALEPFREGNELHNLVGQTDFEIDDTTPTYIDMQQMDGRGETTGLMMRIVFSMLYEQAKETPKRTIIAVDEAHKIIGSEEAASHWEEMFRHSRHHDLSIHLISQELEDFFGTEDGSEDRANAAAKTMARQCQVVQVHRINKVNRTLAKDAMGLTPEHCSYIENAVGGQDGRGYTTALLDVEDIGRVSLRVEATQDELAVVDYNPRKGWDHEDITNPRSKVIRRAISAREGLVDPLPDPDKDAFLREVLADIPLSYLSANGARVFVDRLIEDPETQYTEDDRSDLYDRFNVKNRSQDEPRESDGVKINEDVVAASPDGGVDVEATDTSSEDRNIPFDERRSQHRDHLTDLAPQEVRELAEQTDGVTADNQDDSAIIDELAVVRARAEVEEGGPSAPIQFADEQ